MRKRIVMELLIVLLIMTSLCRCSAKEEKQAQNIKVIASNDPKEKEEADEVREITNSKKDIIIALDPGHQGESVDMSAKEPNAPGSSEMKTKASTGTAGNYSGIPEYQLTLDISLEVRNELKAQGYNVIMTREDNEKAISNAERATLANDAGADVMIRIHANGSEDASANGALALISSESNPYVGRLYGESYHLAEDVLNAYCESTEMPNDGIQENDTMTGINWSSIPVMILEMGFMSNEIDDMNMADLSYREKMVSGIVKGIQIYFGQTQQGERLGELDGQMKQVIQEATDAGELWGVYVKDLSNGNYSVVGNQKLQAASIIKLFIVGAVYENLETVNSLQGYDGETSELLKVMISQSDNDAANTLVERLGGGDKIMGLERVNQFCTSHGHYDTHMGRLMLETNENDDNYTSVEDCGRLLEDYCSNSLLGSSEILSYMGEQERVSKIPAGLPEGTDVANKTGELSDVENDVAIIQADGKTYILCVMSNRVQVPQNAVDRITQLSSVVYQTLLQ